MNTGPANEKFEFPPPDPGLRVYRASYGWTGGWGAYEDIDAICIAENKSQAHTWAVMTYPESDPNLWHFEEIDSSQAGCHHVTSRSN
jgi:hypothetical protein